MTDFPQTTIADIFPLADRLRQLRELKDRLKADLSDVSAEISTVEDALADCMAEAECPSFTRDGKMFVLTTTTRWSAETDRKEALYEALRKNGHEDLFTVNSQTLGSFLRETVSATVDENGETHVPDWLVGLVKSYDDVGITMKTSAKKSK